MATEQIYEEIEGVEGLVGTRVIEMGGQLFFEAELQEYEHGRFASPPILRIPIEDDTPERRAWAKSQVPEGLAELFGA